MSTIMSQVTCSPCDMKNDELRWHSNIVSTNHLDKCGKIHNEVKTKHFKMIFDIRPKLQEIYNLESEKTHDFWQL